MDAIKPYVGFILIACGLALAFAGGKLLIPAFGLLFFLSGAGLIFMVSYNFLPAGSASPVWLGVIAFFAIVIGAVVASVTKKFAEEWAMALLAAWGGIMLCLVCA